MEDLNVDNILSDDDIDAMFGEDSLQNADDNDTDDGGTKEPEPQQQKDNDSKQTDSEPTIEVDEDELIDSLSEGVDRDTDGDGEDSFNKQDPSPNYSNKFFSSIADALKKERILPDLDDQTISSIKTAEDFAEAIEMQISAKLDERQKRIEDALNFGADNKELAKYENTLNSLKSITDSQLEEESEEGESLRKTLIYNDLLNRGYSEQRAKAKLERSIKDGTDVEDAKDALQGNLEVWQKEYDNYLDGLKKEEEDRKVQLQQRVEKLKKSILEDKDFLGGIEVDSKTRNLIYNNLSKPVYKDSNSGRRLTALQKYEIEHKEDYLKYVSALFTLTDGFKNFNKLIDKQVNKKMRKGLNELEATLKGQSGRVGNLRTVGITEEDNESYLSKNWKFGE